MLADARVYVYIQKLEEPQLESEIARLTYRLVRSTIEANDVGSF